VTSRDARNDSLLPQRVKVGHHPGALVGLASFADGVVQVRLRLRFVFGLEQVPDGAKSVRVAAWTGPTEHRPMISLAHAAAPAQAVSGLAIRRDLGYDHRGTHLDLADTASAVAALPTF